MSYEIRPLEWQMIGISRPFEFAEVFGWAFKVRQCPEQAGHEYRIDPPGRVGKYFTCSSIEDGKAACEAHWRAQIAACLVEVPSAARALASLADWLMERATHPANNKDVQ